MIDQRMSQEPGMDPVALGVRIPAGTKLKFEYLNGQVDCEAVVLTVDQALATSVADQLKPLMLDGGDQTAITHKTVFKTVTGDSLESVREPAIVVKATLMVDHSSGEPIVPGGSDPYAKGYIPNVVDSVFSLVERDFIV